jgi:hypothetical protein
LKREEAQHKKHDKKTKEGGLWGEIVKFCLEILAMVCQYVVDHMQKTGQDIYDVFNMIDQDG